MNDPRAAEVLGWMRAREEAMTALLEVLARAESPSGDAEGLARALGIVAAELRRLGMRVRPLPGAHLYARPAARVRGGPCQLLLGHVDTVWPRGTLGEMPLMRGNGRLRGPGVLDMKGGLVQMVFALAALRDLGIAPAATPLVLVNGDEEVGSRSSTRWVRALAALSARALVLEPAAGPCGLLKTARKGVGRFTVTVRGRAAHAGLEPESGASAILELSHQIQTLFALNDAGRGVTVNVGMVDGGLRPNVVAPVATAVVDARVRTHGDAARITRAIHGLHAVGPGTSLDVQGGFGRAPLEPTARNRALREAARRIARHLGLELGETAVGGASDGNTTSLLTATLDGLGPVGEGAHAPHEHVVLARMPERAALVALLLAEPLEGS